MLSLPAPVAQSATSLLDVAHEYDVSGLLKALKAFLLPGLTDDAHETLPEVWLMTKLQEQLCAVYIICDTAYADDRTAS